MPSKLTLQNFIDKANKIHNFKFNYSKFILIDTTVKGIIICPIHGEFIQLPRTHLEGKGCRKCGGNEILTIEEFIKRSNIAHNFRYDYSKFIMKGADEKGTIICSKHGEFSQKASSHMDGRGCDRCGGTAKLTLEDFLERANLIYNFKFNYSKFIINGINTNGIIICPIHGEFLQNPASHFKGVGCKKCTGRENVTLEIFIKRSNKIHKFKYNYSKFVLLHYNTKGIIICPEHGEFSQTPRHHLSYQGCPDCKNRNQGIVTIFLNDNNFEFIKEYKLKLPINKKYSEIDFYIPFLNLFIEYNGGQHYFPVTFGGISQIQAEKEFKRVQIRDQQLREYCQKNNINLLEIDGREYINKKLENFLYAYFFNILAINAIMVDI